MKHSEPLLENLNLPVIAAPMFLISGPELVINCCKNGVIGTFPALNQRSSEGFEEWLIQIKEELKAFEEETGKKAAPFGVNLIVHPSNPRIDSDLQVVTAMFEFEEPTVRRSRSECSIETFNRKFSSEVMIDKLRLVYESLDV